METIAAVWPQPLIGVAEVERASRWYRRILGAESGHGGGEYERIEVAGVLVLQLHALTVDHHHGLIGDPDRALGNGLLLWFAVADFDAAVARVRAEEAVIDVDVHVNPNARQREIWLRDLDGYRVVLAEASPA